MDENTKAMLRKRAAIAMCLSWPVELIDALSATFPVLRERFMNRMNIALACGQWRGRVVVWRDEMLEMIGT